MKHTEVKMKPIEIGNPDVEVKMKPTEVEMKPIEQILVDGFHFEGDDDDFISEGYQKIDPLNNGKKRFQPMR